MTDSEESTSDSVSVGGEPGNPTNPQRDFYDTISDDRIREIAKKRGIPKYKTDLFVGTALREYMRAVDYDQERAEEGWDSGY